MANEHGVCELHQLVLIHVLQQLLQILVPVQSQDMWQAPKLISLQGTNKWHAEPAACSQMHAWGQNLRLNSRTLMLRSNWAATASSRQSSLSPSWLPGCNAQLEHYVWRSIHEAAL